MHRRSGAGGKPEGSAGQTLPTCVLKVLNKRYQALLSEDNQKEIKGLREGPQKHSTLEEQLENLS